MLHLLTFDGSLLTSNYTHARAIISCKELPAAVEARWERKSMAENLRTSLCLELAERSMPPVEEVCYALSHHFISGTFIYI